MKVPAMFSASTAAAFLVLVACGSSSNSGDAGNGPGAGPPTCQGATGQTGPGSPACSSCVQSSCGSQSAAVQTSCGAYVACYQGCQCSDLTCIQGCLSKIDSTCQNPYGSLASCLSQSCASPCAGASVSDGGAG